jgi:nucleoside-diphosphate-sugar epimerase
MKKVLITGCSGFLGWHISNYLNKDYELHGLDINPSTFQFKDFYQQDINRLFTISKSFDAVIHLSALTNDRESKQMPIMYFITNINGTMNILNKVITKNFIYPSITDGKEETAYTLSKRAGELVVKEYCTTHNVQDYSILKFDLSTDEDDYLHRVILPMFKAAIENPINNSKTIY